MRRIGRPDLKPGRREQILLLRHLLLRADAPGDAERQSAASP
jgi:hypothetical protein